MKTQQLSFSDQIQLQYHKKTLTLTFQITDACNLKCTYCYQQNKQNHIMQLTTAQQTIKSLLDGGYNPYIDINHIDELIIEFIGGEPFFLQTQLIDDILTYYYNIVIQYNHKIKFHWQCLITTNGTLLHLPEVQQFIDKWRACLSLAVSLDGDKQIHNACRCFPNGSGSYDIVKRNILAFRNTYGYLPNNKITIAPTNLPFLAQGIVSLFEMGYTELPANCVYEEGWTIEDAKIFYQQLKIIANYLLEHNNLSTTLFNENLFHPLPLSNKENWCGGNGRMLAVDWKGDLYPCLRYMESSVGNDKPYIIGNVKDGIINPCKELKKVNRINQSPLKCLTCPIAYGCGYCQAYNYQVYGDFKHRATYICEMHQARSLANVYYWNKYYQKHNIDKEMLMWLPKKKALQIINLEEWKMLYDLSLNKKQL